MVDSLEQLRKFGIFNGMYEIVKSVIVEDRENNHYRIDIMRDYDINDSPYIALCYVQNNYNLQPTYPSKKKSNNGPEKILLWASITDIPLVRESTIELAINQSLAFLAKRSIF